MDFEKYLLHTWLLKNDNIAKSVLKDFRKQLNMKMVTTSSDKELRDLCQR